VKPFEHVAIIGPGLIGASMGLAMKAANLAGEIVGIGRRESSLETALEVGAIDRSTLDLREGVRGADLVVLATGVETCLELGLAAMPHLKPGCLLTDVASAKALLLNGLAPCVRPDVSYVSSHPMAGSERKGAQAARPDLFRDAICILTRTAASRGDGFDRLRALWEAMGARTCELDASTHDDFLAQVSHLPHVAAACLVQLASREGLRFAATGFKDTTRVASSDPEIWREIYMANRSALALVLRRYAAELAALAVTLEKGDSQAVMRLLCEAKQKRDGLKRET
jgi:prephenate dehydrogenase